VSRIPVSKKDRVRSEAKKRRVSDFLLARDTTLEETNRTTAIPHTGGGALTALRTNELRDGGTYTLPLASSTLVNQVIIIELPDEYSISTPIVNTTGADTITYSGVADTSILFDLGVSVSVSLTSDGISSWSL